MSYNISLRDYHIPQYVKNFNYLNNYQNQHRPHQIEAILKAKKYKRGIIISPCGTGKTRIQSHLLTSEAIDLSIDNKYGVFGIASHRLSLNRQLLDNVVEVYIACGISFNVLFIGSGNFNLDDYYSKYLNKGYSKSISDHLVSISSEKIEAFIKSSKEKNRHVLVASTYDSINCLKNIGLINLITFDEAHNTTQNDFKKNITEIKDLINKEYYFTATPKTFGPDKGMNDKEFYGPIIIDISPKLMIDQNEICHPKLHIIKGENDQISKNSNLEMITINAIDAFLKHKSIIKEVSVNPNNISGKLLIACNSINEMEEVSNNNIFKSWAQNNKIKIFTISSKSGCKFNWTSLSKEAFFQKLNDLIDNEDAIIFNVDMLTEGIDLPTITGVMPLRNLGQIKLIQLIGRALRLHKQDRSLLYANKLSVGDYKNFIKPYGYVVIPRHLASVNEHDNMIGLAKLFYSEYGTKPSDLIIQENYTSLEPSNLNSIIPLDLKDSKFYSLEHEQLDLIEECNLINLRDKLKNLNNFSKNKFLEDLLL